MASTTFTAIFSRELPNGHGDDGTTPCSIARDAAVALLHDHPAVLALSPLMVRYERIDDEEHNLAEGANAAAGSDANAANTTGDGKEIYLVWDSISYLPGTHLWDGELEIRAEFANTGNGTRVAVAAPMGFRSRSEWAVWKDEGSPAGGWKVVESVTATCPWGLAWFVEGTMRRAHEVVLDRFVERVKEKVVGKVVRKGAMG